MSFRILGLDPSLFRHYGGMSEQNLRRLGAVRVLAEAGSDFPCRVTLENTHLGEYALLLNYPHHPGHSPLRTSGPIFVWEQATERHHRIGEVPASARPRLYSLRCYYADGKMVDADLVEGAAMEAMIEHFFASPVIRHLHAHHARRGCYAFLVERA